ncbi:CC-NBS-LRR resistance protein [Trifolium medium]|uniref:CC-NBS-LRR resistance protein n=1 Tax=Trifolium medium TaxID=97028 RepID=A0A392M682_9FABA|nr:CC-NBS-LRR resistance protein [Trifolium medium]
MAEQIPYAVAESLFNRLASATFREHGQIHGVMDELERLKNSVECIRVVLLDAQEKQEQNCVVQKWIRRIEDVLHCADDLLDEFIIEGMRYKADAGDKKKMARMFRPLSSNHLRRTMVPKIKKIQKEFDDAVEEITKLKLSPKATVVKQTDSLRSKHISILLESDITGREDDKKNIINLLKQPCQDKESIMSILKLSYRNLSLQLRQCFAYCSLYPKDWEIEKDTLIQLWMAQGYLECSDEKQLMEDVGNEFVKIFFMNSFFQDAKVGEDGDIVSFKMHDLMHDLATEVAGNDCCYMDSEAKRCEQRPVHVSLEPNALHLLDSLDPSRLRTLILLSSNEEEELNVDELSIISKFKHLRVLKLSYCSLSKLSSSIGKLKHLRYLNLSHCRGLKSLYKSFSRLVLLQTLILIPNEKVKFSTKVLSKLINLRHLHISDWEASKDKTPFGFVKLSIWQHKGMTSSNWISSLTNIVEISFFLCGSLQCLPPLEHLPFLKSLDISFLEELEYIYYEQDFSSAFFPSLENLSLQFCYKLKGWRRVGDDFDNTNCSQNLSLPPFPRLSQLSIIGCLMLTCMPTFPNLENRLELYDSKVETLVATLNTVASEILNDVPPLSMLKSLHIDGHFRKSKLGLRMSSSIFLLYKQLPFIIVKT